MFKIESEERIEDYFCKIQEIIRERLTNDDLDISIVRLKNDLTKLKIKSISKDEDIMLYGLKMPTIKSDTDTEILKLTENIINLYNKTQDKYYFYLSDVFKKIKLSHILKEFSLINRNMQTYRDFKLSSYYYGENYSKMDISQKYSTSDNKLKILDEIELKDVKRIYKALKEASKKESSSYTVKNIWEDESLKKLSEINYENLDNVRFIKTITTSLDLIDRREENYTYVLKEMILNYL